MTDRPTLIDLRAATGRLGAVDGYTLEGRITTALHAGGFTIPCDECEGSGHRRQKLGRLWVDDDCPRCAGSGVLSVGILPAPVDEDALLVSIDRAVDGWCSSRAAEITDAVMAVLREAGVLDPKAGS